MAERSNPLWDEYFSKTQEECPWSTQAWQKGRIAISEWQGSPEKLEPYAARIYTLKGTRRLIIHLCERLNKIYPEDTWFWSHPDDGHLSTPVPCLIQQNKQHLEDIRNAISSK